MGTYFRLVDVKDPKDKEKQFLAALKDKDSGQQISYTASQKDFEKIPGSPIAYWVSERIANSFKVKSLNDKVIAVKGLDTCDNDQFVRTWEEVNNNNIDFSTNDTSETFNCKWFPYAKGGGFRKWYGLNDKVVNWDNDGKILRNLKDNSGKIKSRPQNTRYYFKKGLTWSTITSNKLSMRYLCNSIFGGGGSGIFSSSISITFLSSFLNSSVAEYFLKLLNPTFNFLVGDILALPLLNNEYEEEINNLSKSNISLSKLEWDSRETSWDFLRSPLLTDYNAEPITKAIDENLTDISYPPLSASSRTPREILLSDSYNSFTTFWTKQFVQMHKNEEELNRIFIEIYGLQDEMEPYVEFTDITLLKDEADIEEILIPPQSTDDMAANDTRPEGYLYNRGAVLEFHKEVLITQLISYAVGCMMGRYSIDKDGLIMANSDDVLTIHNNMLTITGGDGSVRHEIHSARFIPDEDGIVPVMGSQSHFPDDAAVRIKEFVSVIWGEDTLVENINFINDALSAISKNMDLEKYCTDLLWDNHVKMYKKKPIYWCFASNTKSVAKSAFKVLVYMHRMNRFTVQQIRNKYLLPYIGYLREKIGTMEQNEATLTVSEVKALDKLRKDLMECVEYDELIKDLANKQIEFDLDNGVTENYKLFKGVVAEI